MKLTYSKDVYDHLQVLERMEAMTLAFKKEVRPGAHELILLDGKEEITGIQEVNDRLDLIASELHGWYYCNC